MFDDRLFCDADVHRAREAQRDEQAAFLQPYLDGFLETMSAAGNPGQDGWPPGSGRISRTEPGPGWYLTGRDGAGLGILYSDGTLDTDKFVWIRREEAAAYLVEGAAALTITGALWRHLEANGLDARRWFDDAWIAILSSSR